MKSNPAPQSPIADASEVRGNTVQFMNQIEGALCVSGSFHVHAHKILGLHGRSVCHQRTYLTVSELGINIEPHVGEFQADISVQSPRRNFRK